MSKNWLSAPQCWLPLLFALLLLKVEIVTSEGNIVVNLNEKAAPTTVANFVKYAKEGFYNGTIFHRVINNFMIQGGGFDRNLHQKSTHAPIKLEDKNGLKNTVGTIAMARTNNPRFCYQPVLHQPERQRLP